MKASEGLKCPKMFQNHPKSFKRLKKCEKKQQFLNVSNMPIFSENLQITPEMSHFVPKSKKKKKKKERKLKQLQKKKIEIEE